MSLIQRDAARRPANRALICSYPKSGRTWLRYMLANVLVAHCGLDMKLDLTTMFNVIPNDDLEDGRGWPGYLFNDVRPCIAASHEKYRKKLHHGHNIVFLIRDPRAVIVSYWFHQTKHLRRFKGDIGWFLKDSRYGIPGMLDYLETWVSVVDRERMIVVTYEEMHADTFSALKRVCDFLEIHVGEDEIRAAVAAGEFSRMREMELENGVGGHIYDRGDVAALRVRSGRVQGFAEHLDEADESVVEAYLATASPRLRKILDRTGYLGK